MEPMKNTVLSLKNMKANYKIKRTFIRISRSPLPAGFFLPNARDGMLQKTPFLANFTGEKIKEIKNLHLFYTTTTLAEIPFHKAI